MKRLLVVSAVVFLGVAAAFAGTIQIPFMFDNGSTDAVGGFPSTGVATWVCVKNPSTSAALVITVEYFDNDGTDRSPIPNTYTIPAGSAVSWRPVADDAAEGPLTGQLVPNKSGGKFAGTVVVTYAGTAQVIGRVNVCDGGNDSQYGYVISASL